MPHVFVIMSNFHASKCRKLCRKLFKSIVENLFKNKDKKTYKIKMSKSQSF